MTRRSYGALHLVVAGPKHESPQKMKGESNTHTKRHTEKQRECRAGARQLWAQPPSLPRARTLTAARPGDAQPKRRNTHELNIGVGGDTKLRVACLAISILRLAGDDGMLALFDFFEPTLKSVWHLAIAHRDTFLCRSQKDGAVGHYFALYGERDLRGVITQRAVRVELPQALDNDATIFCHVMHSIPIRQCHLILNRRIGGHFAGQTHLAEGVFGFASY